MLPTFVIGLREGLEAALIVGIIAGFLADRGRRDALRQVWLGVGAAVADLPARRRGAQLVSADLPQAGQEGLETVIGLLAVAMVTYMILWMRRTPAECAASSSRAAESALARGSTGALVAMAFLAVLREGFETVVFLLAAFQASTSPCSRPAGRADRHPRRRRRWATASTAAGSSSTWPGSSRSPASFLVARGRGPAHERGAHRPRGGLAQRRASQRAADLSWLVQPGTPISSLVTGCSASSRTPPSSRSSPGSLPRPDARLRALAHRPPREPRPGPTARARRRPRLTLPIRSSPHARVPPAMPIDPPPFRRCRPRSAPPSGCSPRRGQRRERRRLPRRPSRPRRRRSRCPTPAARRTPATVPGRPGTFAITNAGRTR